MLSSDVLVQTVGSFTMDCFRLKYFRVTQPQITFLFGFYIGVFVVLVLELVVLFLHWPSSACACC